MKQCSLENHGIIYQEFEDHEHDRIQVRLSIPAMVIPLLDLTEFDRSFLKECDESLEVSDKLLALEFIVRKSEKKRTSKAMEAKLAVVEP